MASVQGNSWDADPEYGDCPDSGCSHTASSSRATSFSAADAGTSQFCGSLRSAQAAPTTRDTSWLFRCRRMTRRRISSSMIVPSGRTAVGSSSRISSAKDSSRPLCGVADARISASVRGARVRASVLLAVAELVTLWDSSMTTASQVCFRRCATYSSLLRVSIEMMTRLK